MKTLLALFLLCCVGCQNVPAYPRGVIASESVERPTAPFHARITSYSMFPTLTRGDYANATPCLKEWIRPGMVLFAITPGGLVYVHRLNRQAGDKYYLKGDNSAAEDAPITFDQILGCWVNPNDPRTSIRP